MKIMDENYLLNPFRITLAGLFKKKIRVNMVKGLEDRSEYIEKRKGENSQHILFRALIPIEYRRMNDGTDISELDSTRISRFFTYYIDMNKGKADSDSQYCAISDKIINITKKANFKFSNFELLAHIEEQLILMFSVFTTEELNDFQEDINTLIEEFQHNSILASYAETFKKLDFYKQLSCLVVIASTWSCWDTPDIKTAEALALVLLPSSTTIHKESESDSNWKETHISSERDLADELLEKCRAKFNKKEPSDCMELARKITAITFADDSTLGEAYYYLSMKGKKDNKDFDKTLMIKSSSLGYSKANVLINDERPVLWHPLSETHGTARIIINTTNKFTEEFLHSIPAEMQTDTNLKKMIIPASGKKQLQQSVDFSLETRYLLFDEDQDKNFQDMLYILDKISNIEREKSIDAIASSNRWNKTTIHIRVCEDKYSALIDTALKRLGNFSIRLFIIDDEKLASQSLLAEYPLFNSIKSLSGDTLKNGKVTLNFTIISDNNDTLALRLIRESYWISCFAYPGLTVNINLISPHACDIKKELRLNYPSMFENIQDARYTSAVHVLEDLYEISSISDYKLIQHFDAIESTDNSFNYYVVNLGNDVDNLNLAIKLREWSIRNRIDSGKRPSRKTLPTVAFYCENSDVAYLSQNMVVQAIDHGDKWHNNYNLIPFGMLYERYSWNAIDGGYWEKVAESTHLQYCGVKPTDKKFKKIRGLIDYFSRNYNRDSSMAVALSLPYRLFQIKPSKGKHILSYAPIDNLDMSGENIDIVRDMTEQFRITINNTPEAEVLIKDLLYAEHVRWIRWAYSRGWKSAAPEQVLLYMNAGNPKQQLYIARLHGCLCSLDDLKTLAERMASELLLDKDGNVSHAHDWDRFAGKRVDLYKSEYNKNLDDEKDIDRSYSYGYKYIPKDFTEIDRSNILATADIMQTLWLDAKESTNTVDQEH